MLQRTGLLTAIAPRYIVAMEIRSPSLITCFALFLSGIVFDAVAQGEVDLDRAAITAQLDQIYALSLQRGTADELTMRQLGFFAALPTIVPHDQDSIVGRDAVAAFYRAIFGAVTIIDNSYAELEIEIVGTTAVRRYEGAGKFRMADDTVFEAKSLMTDILIKEQGVWKTLMHTWRPLDEPGSRRLEGESTQDGEQP